MNRLCVKCESVEGSRVWTVSDPYYGYGHFPILLCDTCEPGESYDECHEYNKENDDYYLGYTTTLPMEFCFVSGPEVDKDCCWDCYTLINSQKRGYGYILDRSIYFCVECYKKRGGRPLYLDKGDEQHEDELKTFMTQFNQKVLEKYREDEVNLLTI